MAHQQNVDISEGGPSLPSDPGPSAQQVFIDALRELYSQFEPLTMASVANRVGVSEASVCHWLKGRRIPKEAALRRLHAEAAKYGMMAHGLGSVPDLRGLLELRHAARRVPLACAQGDTAAVAPAAQGDRRNSQRTSAPSLGDRRNKNPPTVGKRLPSQNAAGPADGRRGNHAPPSAAVRAAPPSDFMEIWHAAGEFMQMGREDAARSLLGKEVTRHSGNVVEFLITLLRSGSSAEEW